MANGSRAMIWLWPGCSRFDSRDARQILADNSAQHGWGDCLPDNDLNTLFTAICFRGRHPMLPRSVMTNTAKSFVTPPMTSLELRSLSLAQVALRLRQSTLPFSDPAYVEKSVAYEYNNMKATNGKNHMYPIGSIKSRQFGVTAWAKLGLTSPKFGKDLKAVSCTTYNANRVCATLTDSEGGDWRVDVKLSNRAWKSLQLQMDAERKVLRTV
jgi:hypothetical protein